MYSSPKRDWHLISPYRITAKPNMRYHGNKGNNHQVMKLLIVKQIPLAVPYGMYREQCGEYLY